MQSSVPLPDGTVLRDRLGGPPVTVRGVQSERRGSAVLAAGWIRRRHFCAPRRGHRAGRIERPGHDQHVGAGHRQAPPGGLRQGSVGTATNTLQIPFWVEPTAFDFRDGIMYFAFTDRFKNGDPSNDSQVPNVDPIANYQGGDFAGIQQAMGPS